MSLLNTCPDCKNSFKSKGGIEADHWRCQFCYGELLSFSMLRKLTTEDVLNTVLNSPRGSSKRKKKCVFCSNIMEVHCIGSGESSFQIDICVPCKKVWFDSGELTRTLWRKNKKVEVTLSDNNPVVDEQIVYTEIDVGLIAEALAGIPNIDTGTIPKFTPKLTYTFIFILFAAQIWVNRHPLTAISTLGLYSDHPFKNLGANLFTYAFVHSGLLHLVGNALFFFLFGGLLEASLGSKILLETTLVSIICSAISTVLLSPSSGITIGFSGAVMGVMTFYCLSFPNSIVSFSNFLYMRSTLSFNFIRTRITASSVFLLYLGLNLVGYYAQKNVLPFLEHLHPRDPASAMGLDMFSAACLSLPECEYLMRGLLQLFSFVKNTSFLGHLGGLIGGLLTWIANQQKT